MVCCASYFKHAGYFRNCLHFLLQQKEKTLNIMINMKKFVFVVFIFIFLFNAFDFALPSEAFSEGGLAQENQVEIDFFYSSTCPHCAKEKKFLTELGEEYSEIKVNELLFSENIKLLISLYQEYNVLSKDQGYVPIVFVGDKYFLGFDEKIEKNIENCIWGLIEGNSQEPCEPGEKSEQETLTPIDLEEGVDLPIVGKINLEKYSLPVLAVVLGILDGFNVCSLGALVLILGLVLAIKSRKKTLLFGGIFIVTTAIVYGLLIVIWYHIFSFLIPYMRIMQILIGLLGIGGGIYFFKEFLKFKKHGPTCEIGAGRRIMAKFSSKFQYSLKNSSNIVLLLGSILLFAGIITIIEFPCSAVVPVAFAGVLAQSGLSTLRYLLYIAIFLVFYMLDEIIVFLVAFFTMKIWLASSKAVTWITLLEAIILLALGFYYLF